MPLLIIGKLVKRINSDIADLNKLPTNLTYLTFIEDYIQQLYNIHSKCTFNIHYRNKKAMK